MPLSPIDFQFHTHQQFDLAGIPTLSPDERQELLERYVKLRDDLAVLLSKERETLSQAVPSYWGMRKLSKLMRQHRSAELAVERLQTAIAKVERTEPTDRPLLSAQGVPNGLETECHSKRARTIRQKSDTIKNARVRR